MANNRFSATTETNGHFKEAVCIDTNRIYDSCADRDCLKDLNVIFTDRAQCIVDKATSVRCRGCEIVDAYINVETMPFNRGCYSVDILYFFKLYLDVHTTPIAPSQAVCGLATYNKKCILYGSEGNVRVFTSQRSPDELDMKNGCSTAVPKAKVQVVDPICLEVKLCTSEKCCDTCCEHGIPQCIARCFDGEFVPQTRENGVKVTLGLFSIVQLERDVQLLIPSYDYCIPSKECCVNSQTPCDAFGKICFPMEEFFPPDLRKC